MKIDIGPFSFEIMVLGSPDDQIAVSASHLGTDETRIDVSAELSGLIEQVGVAAIVQFIKTTGKTGILRFYQKNTQGQVWIDTGDVIHAEYGSLYGLQAALTLLSSTDGAGRSIKAPAG